MRDQGVSGSHTEQCSTDRRGVCQYQCNGKHAGSTLAKSGNGWCDKSDDDQRNAEGNDLSEQMFCCDNDVHKGFVGDESDQNTDDYSCQ